jgi:hypothetical protein
MMSSELSVSHSIHRGASLLSENVAEVLRCCWLRQARDRTWPRVPVWTASTLKLRLIERQWSGWRPRSAAMLMLANAPRCSFNEYSLWVMSLPTQGTTAMSTEKTTAFIRAQPCKQWTVSQNSLYTNNCVAVNKNLLNSANYFLSFHAVVKTYFHSDNLYERRAFFLHFVDSVSCNDSW